MIKSYEDFCLFIESDLFTFTTLLEEAKERTPTRYFYFPNNPFMENVSVFRAYIEFYSYNEIGKDIRDVIHEDMDIIIIKLQKFYFFLVTTI